MKLENQVISLDLAKRLKELGVKQESLCYWNGLNQKPRLVSYRTLKQYEGVRLPAVLASNDIYSAFTVAELGEILPGQLTNNISSEHSLHQFVTEKSATQWHAAYICADCHGKLGSQWAATEADTRAKMLIYLLEQGLIQVDK